MSVNIISASSPVNAARTVSNSGGDKFNFYSISKVSGYATLPLSTFNQRTSEYKASWSNGTGTLVDAAGSLLFTASGNNGALSQLLLANRGSGTIYFGVNDTPMAIASGGTILGSGESVQLDGPITALWAMAGVGNSILNAMGTRMYYSAMAK